MRTVLGWGARGLAVIVLGLVGWLALVALSLVATHPKLAGHGHLAGADGPVTIVRDRHGVPHIFAGSEADLYRGLGYVHAQDRFFQMDGARRLMQGRLAELLGAGLLEQDARQRTLGWNRTAQAMLERLSPPARAVVEAYAEGVNAGLADTLPGPEYVLLLAGRERWQPRDSLAVALAMTDTLTGGEGIERAAVRLSGRLTPAQLVQFAGTYPDWASRSYRLQDLAAAWRAAGTAVPAVPVEPAGTGDTGVASGGSNAWVVSGSRTASGRPVLANDPHLPLAAPGPFYLARLQGPDRTLVGASLPGAPMIVIGHNGRVAWGTTTHAIDAADDLPLAEGSEVRTRTEPVTVRRFLVLSRTVPVEVRETDLGPVLDRRWFELPQAWGPGERVLRTIADDPDNGVAEAVFRASSATSVDGFLEALAPWTAPPQNLVVADVAGGIGLVSPARYPLRDAAGTWVGDVAAAARLMATDPAAGYFATANNLQTPAGPGAGPATPGGHDPYRVTRITEVLEADRQHTLAATLALQADRQSLLARRLLPVIAAAAPATAAGRALQVRLAAWDAVARAEGIEGTLFALWTRAFGEALYRDELGPELFERFAGPREVLIDAVLTDPAYAGWCDDRATPAGESCPQIVAAALDTAAQRLVAAYGTDPAGWTWGPVHAATFPHPLLSRLPLVGERFTVTVPFGGNSTSVDVARNRHAEPGYATVHAAGLRFAIDMADPAAARFMVTPGQSGHPGSPFYRNLAPAWAAGESFELRTDWGPSDAPPGSRILRLTSR